jgi:glycosyltransferase involved in cell wall biosynthesis
MHRVLLLCEYPTLNGGEQSLLALLPVLRSSTDFTFLALAPSRGPLAEAFAARDIEVLPLDAGVNGGTRSQAMLRAQITRVIEDVKPDLVHANSLSMGRLAGPVAAALGVPSLAHLRDIIGLSGQAVADLNQNSRLLAVSAATRAHHIGQGIDADKTFVAYNGVDPTRFHPRPATGRLHRELAVASDAMLIGTIGQLVLRKGHDVLAEAASLLAREFPQAHYVIVGERYSTKDEAREHEDQLRQKFAEGALAGRAHFLGVRPDIPEIMSELTLLAHPARQEPLGRVLLEAAASGVPVVATDVGGTSEIFPPGAAILVPPNDPPALAAALRTLLEDGELRQRLAATALLRAHDRFVVSIAAAELARHYLAAISRVGAPRPG